MAFSQKARWQLVFSIRHHHAEKHGKACPVARYLYFTMPMKRWQVAEAAVEMQIDAGQALWAMGVHVSEQV